MSFHPSNKNAVVCFNLTQDPQPLLDLSVEQLREYLYTRHDELPPGQAPIGLKLVHVNKCLFAPAKTLLPENAERQIDRTMFSPLKGIKAHPELRDKVAAVFNDTRHFVDTGNPDYQLYSGFISNSDMGKFDIIRATEPMQLAGLDMTLKMINSPCCFVIAPVIGRKR